MDVSATMRCLYLVIVVMANKAISTAGTCQAGSQVTHRPYSETIVNHTIVGPIMASITAINERECETECHLAVPDLCYMFNYHPSSKVCELLYKDRAAEYKVEKKEGSTFKTRRCSCDPRCCGSAQHCVSLGDQNNALCLNFTGRIIKANTAPVCIGAKDDNFGTFFAPADGKIKTIKLVHISGGVTVGQAPKGKWGTLTESTGVELHITDSQNSRVTPATDYPLDNLRGRMRYIVPGFTTMSPELVFPEIFPPLAVTKGKEFRIWFGQDLSNIREEDNEGKTFADVYVFFVD